MLSPDQIKTWRKKSAVIAQIPDDVYRPARDWLNENFTLDHVGPGQLNLDSPDRALEFPTFVEPLDDLVLNEQLIDAAQRLLGTPDIRLSLALMWPKIGAASESAEARADHDQRMHMDYGNNTLLHPEWHQPDAVSAIVYHDSSHETGGGTRFVPRNGERIPVSGWL